MGYVVCWLLKVCMSRRILCTSMICNSAIRLCKVQRDNSSKMQLYIMQKWDGSHHRVDLIILFGSLFKKSVCLSWCSWLAWKTRRFLKRSPWKFGKIHAFCWEMKWNEIRVGKGSFGNSDQFLLAVRYGNEMTWGWSDQAKNTKVSLLLAYIAIISS